MHLGGFDSAGEKSHDGPERVRRGTFHWRSRPVHEGIRVGQEESVILISTKSS